MIGKVRIVFVVCLLLIVFNSNATAGEPMKIGLTLGLTGKYSAFSDMQLKGFKLWQQDVNAGGGVLGRQVELIVYDDKSDPQVSVGLYRKLISEDRVDLLFSPFSSKIVDAVMPLIEKHGYPMMISGASADRLWEQGYKHIFGLFLSASRVPLGFLELLVMNGKDDIAVVYASDAFSQDLSRGVRKWADALKLNILFMEALPESGGEYAGLVRRLKASGPKVLIVCGLLNEVVATLNALERSGGYDGAIFVPVGPGVPEFYERVGRMSENVFSTSQWELHGNAEMPGSREFFRRFVEIYGKEPSYFAATAYASGQILSEAVEKTGSLNMQEIRDNLRNMSFRSIIGRYGVDSDGRQTKNYNIIIQVQGGAARAVWPRAFATGTAVFK